MLYENNLFLCRIISCRSVAQFGRALVSKTSGWGFESLRSCVFSAHLFVYLVSLLKQLPFHSLYSAFTDDWFQS
jgi:hypothetical protein